MAGNGKKVKLAIFDIDGTIFRSSLIVELFNNLIERKVFSKKSLTEINKHHVAWLNRTGQYNNYVMSVVESYCHNLRGVKQSDLKIAVQDVMKRHKNKVYRYTRDLIPKLKKQGYYLIAISGSPDDIVSQFARYLGFNKAFGTLFEIQNGIYTGKRFDGKQYADGITIPPKDFVFQSFMEQEKLNVDLKNSIAVGDTEGDIPLFNLVGNPIVFNPSSDLARLAKKKNWSVIVERKDVIYQINQCKFI